MLPLKYTTKRSRQISSAEAYLDPEHNFTLQQVPELTGTVFTVGFEYGVRYRRLIEGFIAQETPKLAEYQKLAKSSISYTSKYTPNAAQLLAGISKGAELSLLDTHRLFLHEEIYHLKSLPQTHCSAVSFPGNMTAKGGALLGQNWDWPHHYIPWGGLVRLSPHNLPRVLSYHFPGLVSCCGLNSKGLALMWTGAGYFPIVRPERGVSTYAIIFEILLKRSVKEALAFLSKVPRAGSFIFFLADAKGESSVVEATPRKIRIIAGDDALARANLYCHPDMISHVRQPIAKAKKVHSVGRMQAMTDQLEGLKGKATVPFIQEILNDRRVFVDLKGRSLTLSQFVADCKTGILYCRDSSCDGARWKNFRV